MVLSARTGFKVLLALLSLTLVIGFTLIFTLRSERFRAWLEAELSQRSGYTVRLAELELELPASLAANNVEIDKSGELQLHIRRLTVTLTPWDLLTQTVHRIEMEQPVLRLDVQTLKHSSANSPRPLALRHLNVRGGTVVIKNGDTTLMELPNLNLTAANLNLREHAGIAVRADVPALDGEAELQIQGPMRELNSTLVIRAKGKAGLFTGRDANAGVERARLHAKLHMPENQPASVTFESKFREFTVGESRLTGAARGRIEADAKFTEGHFQARGDIENFPQSLAPAFANLPTGAAVINLSGLYSPAQKTLALKEFQVASSLLHGTGSGEIVFGDGPNVTNAKLAVRDIRLEHVKALLPEPANRWTYHNGQVQLDLALRGPLSALAASGVARGGDITARGDNLTLGKLSFAAPFEWRSGGVHLNSAKLQASNLAYGAKAGWQGAVEQAAFDGSLEIKTGAPMKLTGKLGVSGGGFSSPDGTRVGEKFSLAGPFEVKLSGDRKSIDLAGKFATESGELLWRNYYGDMKTPKPALDFEGEFLPETGTIKVRRATLQLGNIGGLSAHGTIDQVNRTPRFDLQLSSADFLPGGFYDFFLRENYKLKYPALDRLAVGGRMAFGMRLRGDPDTLIATGDLSLKSGELRARSNDWQVGPIALELPFSISLSAEKTGSFAATRAGTLFIAGARFAGQTLSPIKTTLALRDNSLRFLEPIRIGIFDGEISISDLAWPDVVRDPKQLAFSAEAKRVGLEVMTEALGWPRFSGTLSGSIPEVQSTAELLRTRGEIQAQLFGGRVRIGTLAIEDPFSSLASIKLAAQAESIQLEQLSKTFAFGSISGVLEGSIDDMVLTDGQPSRLRADLHSVERSGVDQRISVEALNKITLLSSGQEAGALYSGLAGFFDSFRYSKLGFKATLRNDRLTLRGVQSEDEKEYLVVGSWLPPTVNVVSHTQEIAFSELVRRLERIKADKSAAKQ